MWTKGALLTDESPISRAISLVRRALDGEDVELLLEGEQELVNPRTEKYLGRLLHQALHFIQDSEERAGDEIYDAWYRRTLCELIEVLQGDGR